MVVSTPGRPDEAYQGLRYHLSPARVAAQRLAPGSALALGLGALRLETLAPPQLPADGAWVALEPVWSGICGSDLGIITGRSSPYLAPLTQFPAVLGHEVVARRLDTGQAVVVDPSLGCRARGLTLCRACAAHADDGCERRADVGLGPGLLLGFHGQLPGGWATRMWAPAAQLIPVPDRLPLRRAVLSEPLAIVLAGLARLRWQGVERVLVLGAGTLGLLTTWALAGLGLPEVVVQVRHRHQGTMARALGAHRLVGGGPRERAVLAGYPLAPPMWGAPALHPWGSDVVVDTVGSPQTMGEALALCRPGGQVLVLGALARPSSDFSPLWTRNLTVVGTYGYHADGVNHLPVAVGRLADAPALDALVTHAYGLDEYRTALRSLPHHRGGAIKLVFAIAAEGEAASAR